MFLSKSQFYFSQNEQLGSLSNKRAAVVLAGCGAKDGAEITEAVSLLIALQQHKCSLKIFAPNRDGYHVVNHITDQASENEKRNILTEAARIARGNIQPLENLKQEDFDMLCFSGGFGVAKNFCNFAFTGAQAQLNNDIKKILTQFIENKKIIAALCISPILLALIAKELKLSNVKLTLGAHTEPAAKIIREWGIEHIEKRVDEACVDMHNRFVSSPAYMYGDSNSADIFNSASALVKGIISLLR